MVSIEMCFIQIKRSVTWKQQFNKLHLCTVHKFDLTLIILPIPQISFKNLTSNIQSCPLSRSVFAGVHLQQAVGRTVEWLCVTALQSGSTWLATLPWFPANPATANDTLSRRSFHCLRNWFTVEDGITHTLSELVQQAQCVFISRRYNPRCVTWYLIVLFKVQISRKFYYIVPGSVPNHYSTTKKMPNYDTIITIIWF